MQRQKIILSTVLLSVVVLVATSFWLLKAKNVPSDTTKTDVQVESSSSTESYTEEMKINLQDRSGNPLQTNSKVLIDPISFRAEYHVELSNVIKPVESANYLVWLVNADGVQYPLGDLNLDSKGNGSLIAKNLSPTANYDLIITYDNGNPDDISIIYRGGFTDK
ncbi:hypothetical protein A3A70_01715 [candidate division WWE3 bacterium RIFCSPLOWO2_01_FULL_42_11]|uniref:Uncharacterized protein n=1 Tax=candidate division WWE3 bacterium RIFCSPLOWO2_01_FULL_42_11 TaxID=1802627 RepID=A0A1F4VR38_UNCKA|nr:MAG: hypothetical protein A3A70_01715 [candidate division WWE3 bacterium RIFCSPLOWO2_01_FULL_42_11]